MVEITKDINLNQVATLLSRYQFEMKGDNPQKLLEQWLPLYPVRWIRLAVVEALYQGRYKVISVEHILTLWLRRGHPTFHFNHEFERMICHNMLGSMVSNSRSVVKRHLAQTALPSFYQMEQSTHSASSSSETTTTILEIKTEETSEPLLNEDPEGELINHEEDFVSDDLWVQDEPTFIEHSQFEPAATKLTDVRELFAQLMSKSSDLVEEPALPELAKTKAEQGTMSGQSIHEFTPHLDHSALYSKLKASLQQNL